MKPSIKNIPSFNIKGREYLLAHVEQEHLEACPCCQSDNIRIEEFRESNEEVTFNNVVCSKCGFNWMEILEKVKNESQT